MLLDSFTAWLTPTSLFLLLNIVIGTIWLTSLFTTHHHTKQHHHLHHQADHFYSSPPLARAPSLVDRVKSINFGLYKYDPHHSDDYFPPAEHVYAKIKAQQAASAPLARAPSLLDRVKSVTFNDFQFSFFRSEFHHSEPHVHLQTQYEQEPVYPVQRREPEPRVPLEKQHEYKPVADPYPVQRRESKRQVQLETQHEYEPEPVTVSSPVQRREQTGSDLRSRALARAPSLLERGKSINLNDLHLHQFLPFRSEIPIPGPKFSGPEPVLDREPGHYSEDQHVRRSKSDNRKVSGGGSRTAEKKKPAASEKMKKSASEKMAFSKQAEEEEEVERRRPATSRVERTVSIGGDVEVDAKADDFINKFKHQLKLQRLDSILQYKDMIIRGASK